MTDQTINYDSLVQQAMQTVMKQALDHAAAHGLPGQHHFYITFATAAEGIAIPAYLHERFPQEMTIVLQHQFYGLKVDDDGFSVTLSFNKVPERLEIPFKAISIFADPSVNFALQFRPPVNEQKPTETEEEKDVKPDPAAPQQTAEIVSLDSFRKKNT